jgi:prefoldin subunit 5
MTRERIDALEADKCRLQDDVTRLQGEVNHLAPENARLREALANAEANDLVSTILIVVGGGVISYATFAGNVSRRVADMGAGALLGGVLLLVIANVRRRRSR